MADKKRSRNASNKNVESVKKPRRTQTHVEAVDSLNAGKSTYGYASLPDSDNSDQDYQSSEESTNEGGTGSPTETTRALRPVRIFRRATGKKPADSRLATLKSVKKKVAGVNPRSNKRGSSGAALGEGTASEPQHSREKAAKDVQKRTGLDTANDVNLVDEEHNIAAGSPSVRSLIHAEANPSEFELNKHQQQITIDVVIYGLVLIHMEQNGEFNRDMRQWPELRDDLNKFDRQTRANIFRNKELADFVRKKVSEKKQETEQAKINTSTKEGILNLTKLEEDLRRLTGNEFKVFESGQQLMVKLEQTTFRRNAIRDRIRGLILGLSQSHPDLRQIGLSEIDHFLEVVSLPDAKVQAGTGVKVAPGGGAVESNKAQLPMQDGNSSGILEESGDRHAETTAKIREAGKKSGKGRKGPLRRSKRVAKSTDSSEY